jgi:hypothetical protein
MQSMRRPLPLAPAIRCVRATMAAARATATSVTAGERLRRWPSDADRWRSFVRHGTAARRRTSQRVYRHGESICFGNSILIRRMSARTPASMRGRPPKFRDFQRQYRRKPVGAFRNSPLVTCDSPGEAPRRAAPVQGIFPVRYQSRPPPLRNGAGQADRQLSLGRAYRP